MTITIIDDNVIARELALRKRRAELLAQLADIDDEIKKSMAELLEHDRQTILRKTF